MEKIWKGYATIKGGDFKQWFEGLSPINQEEFLYVLTQ